MSPARCRISGGIVAENISVCRSVGKRAQNAADVGEEAHVEHAIRFVEHQHLDGGEIDVVETHVVEQAARRRHHQLRAGAQRALLRPHVDAAHHRHRGDADVVADRQRLLVDLHGQLAGRREDEGAALPARAGVHALQDRKQEGGGLAGAGRRAADQIAPGEADRDGFGLDRRRTGVAHVRHRLGQRRNELELLKRRRHRV